MVSTRTPDLFCESFINFKSICRDCLLEGSPTAGRGLYYL